MQKLKDILAIAKEHWVPVLCAVIAIAAVGSIYYPLSGKYADQKVTLDGRAALAGKIQSLLKATRTLPPLDSESSEGKPLTVFPAQPVIDIGKTAVAQVASQANGMVDAAQNYSVHAPLVREALPAGIDIDRRNFAQQYAQVTTGDARFLSWPDAEHATRPGEPKLQVPRLMAGHRPTATDISAAKDAKKAAIEKQDLVYVAGQVTADSRTAADAEIAAAQDKVQGELQQQTANTIKVYLEPLAFNYDPRFATMDRPPELQDIWVAQLSLWIQEDVATGVAFANESATCVKDAPVKRIFKLDLNPAPYIVKAGDPGAPAAVDAAITKAFDATATGRVCNPFYDVVGFKVTLDCDATKISEVLTALQKGQFVNVVNVKSTAQDSAAAAVDGFFYGPAPIVRLEVQCEELMLRTWVDGVNGKPGLMPPAVRTNLAKLSTAAGLAPPVDMSGNPINPNGGGP
jgi:hypothetical protein